MWDGATGGEGDWALWPPGKIDATGLCEALCEAQQERWPGRGGDLRGGQPSDDAVRAGEERGAAGDAGGSYGTRAIGPAAHYAGQLAAGGAERVGNRGSTRDQGAARADGQAGSAEPGA